MKLNKEQAKIAGYLLLMAIGFILLVIVVIDNFLEIAGKGDGGAYMIGLTILVLVGFAIRQMINDD